MNDKSELPPLPDWAEDMLPKADDGAKPTPRVSLGIRPEFVDEPGTDQAEGDISNNVQHEPGTRTGVVPVLTPVKSSNITAVGHNGSALYIRFSNGAMYRYPSVDAALYSEFRASASIGSFFHHRIKQNHKGERQP